MRIRGCGGPKRSAELWIQSIQRLFKGARAIQYRRDRERVQVNHVKQIAERL